MSVNNCELHTLNDIPYAVRSKSIEDFSWSSSGSSNIPIACSSVEERGPIPNSSNQADKTKENSIKNSIAFLDSISNGHCKTSNRDEFLCKDCQYDSLVIVQENQNNMSSCCFQKTMYPFVEPFYPGNSPDDAFQSSTCMEEIPFNMFPDSNSRFQMNLNSQDIPSYRNESQVGCQAYNEYHMYQTRYQNGVSNTTTLTQGLMTKQIPQAPPGMKKPRKRVKNMFTALYAHCQVCGDRATGENITTYKIMNGILSLPCYTNE